MNRAALASQQARAHMLDKMREEIQPVEPGLLIVACRDPIISAQVRTTIEHQALTQRADTGLPMPKVAKLEALFSVSSRQLDSAIAASKLERLPVNCAEYVLSPLGKTNHFDCCSNEGLCVLQPYIENADGWISISQVFNTSPQLIHALAQIRNTAKASDTYVMMFITGAGSRDVTEMQNFCDDYLEASICDADIGEECAFAIEAVDLHGNLTH